MEHLPDCYWLRATPSVDGDEAACCSCGAYALMHTPVAFGLRAQGHLPTIEQMLREGAPWAEIGRKIGWCPDTAREWYEREVVASSEGENGARS
jgi:hypothetical protein